MPQPFLTTRWSIIARAGEWKPGMLSSDVARAALTELIGAYWQPLYAFARRQGRAHSDAEDLVQGFFARAVEKGGLIPTERRARFRAFLLAAFQHFCANEHARATAQKRGGGATTHALADFADLARLEDARCVDAESPERAFERRFAERVLEQSLARLRDEQQRAGKAEHFAKLEPHLTGVEVDQSQAALAAELGTSAGALKVALHRLRRRYGELLREEVAATIEDPREIDTELVALRDALGAR
ncbi:MAG TPA: sigma-70 family RNA polymerase sigma factor [Planctomycetota bacterium]|nr:sigma-70 family RNA polymerase sigma factor [Planctomycetota bacterium]